MSGPPIFLIITAVVMSLLLLAGVILMVIIFGHPDDKNQAHVPRIITVSALWLAFVSLLVMPYDVANTKSDGSDAGLRVDILWQIVYITMLIFITFLIPFALFYYESDMDEDEQPESFWETQSGTAIKYTFFFLCFFFILLAILYAYQGKAYIPTRRISYNPTLIVAADFPYKNFTGFTRGRVLNTTNCVASFGCATEKFEWVIPVTFPIFVMGFMAFVGWFFFACFAGAGFVALPLDMINDYRTRPEPMTTKVYVEEKNKLADRVSALLKIGEKLNANFNSGKASNTRSSDRQDVLAFEKYYYNIKKDYQILTIAYKLKGGNPIFYFCELVFGIIALGVSICWYIHIVNFMYLPKPSFPWLNEFFIILEGAFGGGFPLFGVLAFALFSFYLLFIVVKGNFKLGVRFLFWKIYPMEIGNTLMSAFLMNSWIILLCSVSAVQFLNQAFPIYTRMTMVDNIFGNQVKFLGFFRYFFANKVFIMAMTAISFLTLLISIVRPENKTAEIEKTLDKVYNSKSTSLDIKDI